MICKGHFIYIYIEIYRGNGSRELRIESWGTPCLEVEVTISPLLPCLLLMDGELPGQVACTAIYVY